MADDFNPPESCSDKKFVARGKMYQGNLKFILDSKLKPSKHVFWIKAWETGNLLVWERVWRQMAQTTSELSKISHEIKQINPIVRCDIQIPGEGGRLSLADAKIIDLWERGAWSSHFSGRQKIKTSQRVLCFLIVREEASWIQYKDRGPLSVLQEVNVVWLPIKKNVFNYFWKLVAK